MSHKLPHLSAQAVLLAALSLLLVFGSTLGIALAQGLDLNRHCQNHGRERAVNTDGTAYGWKCEDSSGVLWDISVESACDEQYGNSYTAQYSNFNDPNSWYCQAPANQQQNDDTGGQRSQQQQQPQSSYSGGMDIAGWCISQGRSGAAFTGDAYSWYCTNSDGSRATDINVDAVCVYSSGGSHPYAGFTDINNPYSWYCATTPQGRPSSGENPAPQPTSAPQTSPSFNYCDFQPVSVGETAQITAGRPNRLRSGAGTSYSQIGSLQPGTQFTIVSGPTCANGYNWYNIRLSNGTTGYTAAGSYGDPWIARVGASTSGSGNTVSPTTPNQADRWLYATCVIDGFDAYFINRYENNPTAFFTDMFVLHPVGQASQLLDTVMTWLDTGDSLFEFFRDHPKVLILKFYFGSSEDIAYVTIEEEGRVDSLRIYAIDPDILSRLSRATSICTLQA